MAMSVAPHRLQHFDPFLAAGQCAAPDVDGLEWTCADGLE
jgi:hypothetical protein